MRVSQTLSQECIWTRRNQNHLSGPSKGEGGKPFMAAKKKAAKKPAAKKKAAKKK
jgi:hypothetical protein